MQFLVEQHKPASLGDVVMHLKEAPRERERESGKTKGEGEKLNYKFHTNFYNASGNKYLICMKS
jgi:DNA-binding GntR family transcriptional regulator